MVCGVVWYCFILSVVVCGVWCGAVLCDIECMVRGVWCGEVLFYVVLWCAVHGVVQYCLTLSVVVCGAWCGAVLSYSECCGVRCMVWCSIVLQ